MIRDSRTRAGAGSPAGSNPSWPRSPRTGSPDPAWLFERKFDGERCLAFRAGQQLRLMTRNRQQVTSTYPEAADALRAQQASDFIARRRRCMPEKQRRRWREAMPQPSRCLDDRPRMAWTAAMAAANRPAWQPTTGATASAA